jgi:hypothetical protein
MGRMGFILQERRRNTGDSFNLQLSAFSVSRSIR